MKFGWVLIFKWLWALLTLILQLRSNHLCIVVNVLLINRYTFKQKVVGKDDANHPNQKGDRSH